MNQNLLLIVTFDKTMRKLTKKIFSGLNDRQNVSPTNIEKYPEVEHPTQIVVPVQSSHSAAVSALTAASDDDSPTTTLRTVASSTVSKPPPIITSAKLPISYPRFLPSELPMDIHLQFLKIPSFGTAYDADNKPYTVYCLEVRSTMTMPSTWTVFRRFSQFCRLRQTLQDVDNIKLPELPPRSHEFSVDQTVIRKRQLESWLFTIVEMHLSTPGMEPLIQNDKMRRFMTDNFNVEPLSFTITYASPRRSISDLSIANTPSSPGGSKVSIHDFNVVTTIGKGAFGQVFLVKSKRNPGDLYALKSIRRKDIVHQRQYEIIERERRIMEQLHCPFIVELHYVLKTKESLFFVLDYCAGGELLFHLARLGHFPERMARFYCAELCLALEYLHDRDIVYRDLKPENILLSGQGHVKLVDFGLARSGVPSYKEGARTYCGTEQYLAPEVLDRREYGKAIDWWALGMILFEMLTGLPPWYNADNRHEVFAGIRYGVLKFPRYISRMTALFIQALLTRDVSRRLGSMRGSREVKEHPYFHSIDWIEMEELQVIPPMVPCTSPQDVQCAKNFEDEFKSLPVNSFCSWDELVDIPDNIDFSCEESCAGGRNIMLQVDEEVDEDRDDEPTHAREELAAYSNEHSDSKCFMSDSIGSRQFSDRGLFAPPSPAYSFMSSSSTAVPMFSASESLSSTQDYSLSSYGVDATLARTPSISQSKCVAKTSAPSSVSCSGGETKKIKDYKHHKSLQQYDDSCDTQQYSGRCSEDYVDHESREEHSGVLWSMAQDTSSSTGKNSVCQDYSECDNESEGNIVLPSRKSGSGFTLSPQIIQNKFQQFLRL